MIIRIVIIAFAIVGLLATAGHISEKIEGGARRTLAAHQLTAIKPPPPATDTPPDSKWYLIDSQGNVIDWEKWCEQDPECPEPESANTEDYRVLINSQIDPGE